MSCNPCSYDFKSARYFSHDHTPLDFTPSHFSGGGGDDDNIGLNSPDYNDMAKCWRLMRDAVAGQEAIKKNAFTGRYVLVPAGLLSEHKPLEPTLDAQNYIERGRFPEVPIRHLQEVEGQLFSEAFEITGPDELLEVVDGLDKKALSLESFAREVVREYFSVYRYGVYIQFNTETSLPEFVRYPAESIVNYVMGDDGFPALVVIEEKYRDTTNVYSHIIRNRRIQLSMEEGRFTYRVFEQEDEKWVENEALAVIPNRTGNSLERIPFVMFGDWGLKPAPLKPIVETTIDYFRAHVEWSHSLYMAAHPTLYLNLGVEGEIVGVGEDDEYSIDIGASTAHMFKDGELKYAETSGAGLAALERRVLNTRDELAGLGARSFINYSSNITARTESLQQGGEMGVLSSFSRDIGLKITECLFWAAEWLGLPTDEISFNLDESQTDDNFDPKCLPVIYEGIDRGLWSSARVRGYVRHNEPSLMGDKTDEEIDQEIADEGAGFGVADLLGDLDNDGQ